MRRWLLWGHRTCGLILAVYAILLGVSGSVLVFREELTAIEYPDFHSGGGAISISADRAADAAAMPGWGAISLTWPSDESPHFHAYLLPEGGGSGAREVYVDARDGAVVGSRDPSAGWVGWLMRLHVNFHAGSVGRTVNGVGALALVGMSISGAVLWWPVSPRRRALSWRVHYWSGAAAALFLAVLGITGVYYVWSGPFFALADTLGRAPYPSMEKREAGAAMLPLGELVARAEAALPGLAVYRASIADAADQAVQVTFRLGAAGEFHKVSSVLLDPVTGAVLQTARYEERPAGNSLLAWISVLHFGRWGGIGARLLWCLLAWSLPVLGVTGFLMWRR